MDTRIAYITGCHDYRSGSYVTIEYEDSCSNEATASITLHRSQKLVMIVELDADRPTLALPYETQGEAKKLMYQIYAVNKKRMPFVTFDLTSSYRAVGQYPKIPEGFLDDAPQDCEVDPEIRCVILITDGLLVVETLMIHG